MVGVVESVEGRAVVVEEAELGGEGVEFVEVETELEEAVAELVHLWREPMMHHAAIVEAGT